MERIMLKSKLHKAVITRAEPEYEGSLGIDRSLMDAVGLAPYEKILISNMSNTNRFETYAIPEPAGSGVICLNGPAARLGSAGDRIVIFAFCSVAEQEVSDHRPRILILDEKNRPSGPVRHE